MDQERAKFIEERYIENLMEANSDDLTEQFYKGGE